MIKHIFGADGGSVTVEGKDAFYVDADGEHGNRMTRSELTEFRYAIDQALNTSAEELSNDEAYTGSLWKAAEEYLADKADRDALR